MSFDVEKYENTRYGNDICALMRIYCMLSYAVHSEYTHTHSHIKIIFSTENAIRALDSCEHSVYLR